MIVTPFFSICSMKLIMVISPSWSAIVTYRILMIPMSPEESFLENLNSC